MSHLGTSPIDRHSAPFERDIVGCLETGTWSAGRTLAVAGDRWFERLRVGSWSWDGMPYEIRTEIAINATPARVWEVLTDFPRYPEWNPFVLEVEGTVRQNATIRYRFEMPRGVRIWTAATVLKFERDSELRFSAHVLTPTVFRGDHYFVIQPAGQNSVTFHHGEIVSGLLFPVVQLILQNFGSPMFQALNGALKQRAEGLR
jgi:hypothetical protein